MFGEVEGTIPDAKTILFYGHFDKQPHMTEAWSEGLHPFKPVIKEGKLYGRGSGDDGYNFFTSILLVKTLQQFNIPHHRFVFTFECDEESGSNDMDYYLTFLKDRIQSPSFVFCMDSGTVDYDYFSLTTSLRGFFAGQIKVSVVSEGQHSGESGLIPDSFRVIR